MQQLHPKARGFQIDLSHDAIITADGNRVITGWNAGAREIYGWTEKEAVGKILHELLDTRAPISTAERDGILARDGRWFGELAHTTTGGTEIVVESPVAEAAPCASPEGAQTGR